MLRRYFQLTERFLKSFATTLETICTIYNVWAFLNKLAPKLNVFSQKNIFLNNPALLQLTYLRRKPSLNHTNPVSVCCKTEATTCPKSQTCQDLAPTAEYININKSSLNNVWQSNMCYSTDCYKTIIAHIEWIRYTSLLFDCVSFPSSLYNEPSWWAQDKTGALCTSPLIN